MRAIGMPVCIATITVLTAPSRSGNWQTAAAIASGTPYRRSWISVITPKRAFGADKQARQIVARARLARPAAGA